jgi:hypothetical protein
MSPKTDLKLRAQFRLIQEVLGTDSRVPRLHRERARELLQFVSSIPANAAKRFPGL